MAFFNDQTDATEYWVLTDGTDGTKPAPHAYSQARGIRRQADYEEQKLRCERPALTPATWLVGTTHGKPSKTL
jgi:hypothetical protein